MGKQSKQPARMKRSETLDFIILVLRSRNKSDCSKPDRSSKPVRFLEVNNQIYWQCVVLGFTQFHLGYTLIIDGQAEHPAIPDGTKWNPRFCYKNGFTTNNLPLKLNHYADLLELILTHCC